MNKIIKNIKENPEEYIIGFVLVLLLITFFSVFWVYGNKKTIISEKTVVAKVVDVKEVEVDNNYYKMKSTQDLFQGKWEQFAMHNALAENTGYTKFEYTLKVDNKEIKLSSKEVFDIGDNVNLVERTHRDGTVNYEIED